MAAMEIPCRRVKGHRHRVGWVDTRGIARHSSDRCRSLYLWSTLAFHLLAGDKDVTLDGKPYTNTRWAARYLAQIEENPMTRATARSVRSSLAARSR